MITYNVTTELKTSWWLKLLRFLRIKSKRQEFALTFDKLWFKEGDILDCGKVNKVKVLGILRKKQ